MANPKSTYARAEVESRDIPESGVFMTSVDNENFNDHIPGRVMTASGVRNNKGISMAGLWLANRTHRLSTPEEIEDWKADQESRRHEIITNEYDRQHGIGAFEKQVSERVAAEASNRISQQRAGNQAPKGDK